MSDEPRVLSEGEVDFIASDAAFYHSDVRYTVTNLIATIRDRERRIGQLEDTLQMAEDSYRLECENHQQDFEWQAKRIAELEAALKNVDDVLDLELELVRQDERCCETNRAWADAAVARGMTARILNLKDRLRAAQPQEGGDDECPKICRSN